jgi:uncharacterized protein YdiU (UPF0061 family)
LTDQREQQRVNEAADRFTNTLVESYRTVADRGVQAQDQNVQFTKDFFNTVISNLHTQAEDNRQTTQQLADQQQRGTEATQALTQESVDAYMNFVNSTFSLWQGGAQAEKKGATEAEKAAKGKKKS